MGGTGGTGGTGGAGGMGSTGCAGDWDARAGLTADSGSPSGKGPTSEGEGLGLPLSARGNGIAPAATDEEEEEQAGQRVYGKDHKWVDPYQRAEANPDADPLWFHPDFVGSRSDRHWGLWNANLHNVHWTYAPYNASINVPGPSTSKNSFIFDPKKYASSSLVLF